MGNFMAKASNGITVFDVAKESGVSKPVVSLVLIASNKVSNKAKERLLALLRQLYYL